MKFRFHFDLTTRLTILTVGAVTCACLAMGIPAYQIARSALQESAEDVLAGQVQMKRLWIVDLFKDKASNLGLMQQAQDIHGALDGLKARIETGQIKWSPGDEEFIEFTRPMVAMLEKYRSAYQYHDVFLISPEQGVVLLSAALESDLGTSLVNGPYRESGLARAFSRALKSNGPVLEDVSFYSPSKAPAAFMAAPAFSTDGTVEGVIAVQLTVDHMNHITQDYTGLRTSGETYLVGEDLLMRSDSRHSRESTILRTRIDTASVREAFLKEHDHVLSVVDVDTDYRGVRVLSSYAPLGLDGMSDFFDANFDWILLGEISVEEAFASVIALRRAVLWLTVGVLAVIGIITFFVSKGISTPIAEGVLILARAASEISSTISQIAAGATETAAAVAQTTTTVEEVRQTAEVSSDSAQDLSISARNAEAAANLGKEASNSTILKMEQINRQTRSLTADVNRLSEGSRDIGDIILSVNDLADQSNLLAVNASIEAAKAGEHGRGFNVVAQEIRNLSVQSKEATRRIKVILGDIGKLTEKAVEGAAGSAEAVSEGIKQAREASSTIVSLAETAEVAARAATQIAASSHQQLVGMEQVAAAMEGINQASGQSRESTANLRLSAENVRTLGDRLLHLVKG